MLPAEINTHIQRMSRRAEKAHDDVLRASHVPMPALWGQLELPEHQVLYGRRGTGKTHLLRNFQQERQQSGDIAVYIDLRRVGAVGMTKDVCAEEQAAELLVDLVESLHSHVYLLLDEQTLQMDLSAVCEALDALAEAVTSIRLVGDVEVERTESAGRQSSQEIDLSVQDLRPKGKFIRRSAKDEHTSSRTLERGSISHYILMSQLSGAVGQLSETLYSNMIWICIDEWSSIPLDLQPLLADLIRKVFFAHRRIVVKISALRGRSRFIQFPDDDNPIGIEVGSDTSATLDLDDYLSFDNNIAQLTSFYSELIRKHFQTSVRANQPESESLIHVSSNSRELIQTIFHSTEIFDRLVANAEGVPRDALQILGLAAGRACKQRLSDENVDSATRLFYLRDKQENLPEAGQLALSRIIEFCLENKSRVVPLRRRGESNDRVIQLLYNARVLHRVQESVLLDSKHPKNATELYDLYVIDIGAFLGSNSTRMKAVLEHEPRLLDLAQLETRGRTVKRRPARWYSQRGHPEKAHPHSRRSR